MKPLSEVCPEPRSNTFNFGGDRDYDPDQEYDPKCAAEVCLAKIP